MPVKEQGYIDEWSHWRQAVDLALPQRYFQLQSFKFTEESKVLFREFPIAVSNFRADCMYAQGTEAHCEIFAFLAV